MKLLKNIGNGSHISNADKQYHVVGIVRSLHAKEHLSKQHSNSRSRNTTSGKTQSTQITITSGICKMSFLTGKTTRSTTRANAVGYSETSSVTEGEQRGETSNLFTYHLSFNLDVEFEGDSYLINIEVWDKDTTLDDAKLRIQGVQNGNRVELIGRINSGNTFIPAAIKNRTTGAWVLQPIEEIDWQSESTPEGITSLWRMAVLERSYLNDLQGVIQEQLEIRPLKVKELALLRVTNLTDFFRGESNSQKGELVQITLRWLQSHYSLDEAMVYLLVNDGKRSTMHTGITSLKKGLPQLKPDIEPKIAPIVKRLVQNSIFTIPICSMLFMAVWGIVVNHPGWMAAGLVTSSGIGFTSLIRGLKQVSNSMPTKSEFNASSYSANNHADDPDNAKGKMEAGMTDSLVMQDKERGNVNHDQPIPAEAYELQILDQKIKRSQSLTTSSLSSAFPSAKYKIQGSTNSILDPILDLPFQALIVGTPTNWLSMNDESGLDLFNELERGMQNSGRWAITIVAEPIRKNQLAFMLQDAHRELELLANAAQTVGVEKPINARHGQLLKTYIARLERGQAYGLWAITNRIFAENEDTLTRLCMVLERLGGVESKPDPLHILKIKSKVSALEMGLVVNPAPHLQLSNSFPFPFKYGSCLDTSELVAFLPLPVDSDPLSRTFLSSEV